MYCLHIHAVVHKIDDVAYVGWVLFLKSGVSKIDPAIEGIRSTVEPQLGQQRVNFAEITTNDGRQEVYRKFQCGNSKRPIFLILHKHPTDYKAGDTFVVIEWGKWEDEDRLREDLIQFLDFFSQGLFPGAHQDDWARLKAFLEEYQFERLRLGQTLSVKTLKADIKPSS
jgi:hypothetical protein